MVKLIEDQDITAVKQLNAAELAALRTRISHLVNEAVQQHDQQGRGGRGSLMDLAGCMRHSGPAISAADAREQAMRGAVDHHLGNDA